MTDLDLLQPDLRQLLQLFSSLDVRFPELDPSSLQVAVARVKERQLELESLEAQSEAVRGALEAEHEALLRKGHRLHAYLKVFAEHDEALNVKVNAFTLPRLRKQREGEPPPALKKRGRPRKPSSTDPLFSEEASAATSPSQ